MPTDISWEEIEHMTDGFSEERIIGSGGYGVVYKGVQENGKKIAVKKLYHRPEIDQKEFQNEIQILTRLEHRNIVRLIGQSYKEQEKCVEYKGNLVLAKMVDRVICLEYLHNGSLQDHLSDELSGLPWHERYQIIKGICEGLNYLHKNSILHLDLKPGNILLDDNMLPKIADFGLSRLFSGTLKSHTTTNFMGTYGFMPPEYIQMHKISKKYDVFSLGVIIIKIMTGPDGYSRQGDMTSQDFIQLVHGNWMTRLQKLESGDASYLDAHSNEVQKCIRIALNCLEPDRHKRPSIGDIIYRLNESETTLGKTEETTDFRLGLTKSLMEGVIVKAMSFITEDSMLRPSAHGDLEFIIGQFQMMNSILNLDNQERNHNVFRTWVWRIRELSYDVEDCIDFVLYQDFTTTWLRRMVPSFLAVAPLPLDEAVVEIQQLKAKVADVSTWISRFSLISESGSNQVTQRQPPTSLNIFAGARATKKKQEDLGDLTQLITMGNSDLGVISVSGSTGGDLRASIIKEVYQDPQVCQDFGCRGWIKLTYPFSLHDFLQSLVIQFYTNVCLYQGTTVDVAQLKLMERSDVQQGEIIEELVKQVDGKKFLLVLEDVCTMVEWDAIRGCLPYSKTGNWIIVSTDQLEIARLCIGHSYQVLELKQYSAVPVHVFFKEGSQGSSRDKNKQTTMVIPNYNEAPSSTNEVRHKGDYALYTSIPTSKNNADMWMDRFPLVSIRKSQMDDLRGYIAIARIKGFAVVSVWGIAGVGKSALVRNLYYSIMRDNRENGMFTMYGWVDLSYPFNLGNFAWSLLLELKSDSPQQNGISNPIQECHHLLENDRCLVVIDGLESTEDWDLIQHSLVSTHPRSTIIVITTEASIATHCCANREEAMYNVKSLEDDEALDLFKMEVGIFPDSSALRYSESPELGKLISKCGGFPKIIVAVADFLAPMSVNWMNSAVNLSDRFMHDMETKPEFDNLRGLFGWMHSYFHTCPYYLKPCILYLSIFPQGQSIRRRRLVRRWIVEGYSRGTSSWSAEEYGEKFFSMLVDLSIIQQAPHSVTNADTRMVLCKVNAFFHEYIISRRKDEDFVFELEGRCTLTGKRTGRHLVIKESWDRDKIVFSSIEFSRLRSLTVYGEWKPFFVNETMRVLQVLDLENATGVTYKYLGQMLKVLPRLKFLSLRGIRDIFCLPNSFAGLRHLETLDVRGTSIATLPPSITKHTKLQYIRAGTAKEPSVSCAHLSWSPSCRSCHVGGVEVPPGIEKLTALHTIGAVNVGYSGGKAILKEINKLTQLHKLEVTGVNKKNSSEFCSAISDHFHLESLSVWLIMGDNNPYLNDMFSSQKRPLENLQSLKLYGLVKEVPAWIRDLPRLTKLELEITMSEEVEVMKILGEIKELRILRLYVKPLKDEDGNKLNFFVRLNGVELSSYLNLKILEIACNSELNVTFGSLAMQNLELLTAKCCTGSAVKFAELSCLSKGKLKEVRYLGSLDNTLKWDMENQLNQHPKTPTLKLEVPCSS